MSTNIPMHKKPTYFEIFKKVLNELSWREVENFEAIEKPEHKRVLNLINATNSEVLSSCIWDFQTEKIQVALEKNKTTLLSDFSGKIISVWEGNKKYHYIHPAQISPNKNLRNDIYSCIGNLITVTKAAYDRNLSVIYVSDQYALDKEGIKKPAMEFQDDTSVLPAVHLEPVLVYGTLIKVKANPSFAKFGYWRNLYLNALANLRSSGNTCLEDAPGITLR